MGAPAAGHGRRPWRLSDLDQIPAGGLAVVGVALLWAGAVGWGRYRRRAADVRPAATAPPAFYIRALRRLGRRGLAPAPAETAREFAERVAHQAPAYGPPLATVTAVYERCRFAGLPLAAGDAADVDAALAALDRARTASRLSE